jgi:hypothetical protein
MALVLSNGSHLAKGRIRHTQDRRQKQYNFTHRKFDF